MAKLFKDQLARIGLGGLFVHRLLLLSLLEQGETNDRVGGGSRYAGPGRVAPEAGNLDQRKMPLECVIGPQRGDEGVDPADA